MKLLGLVTIMVVLSLFVVPVFLLAISDGLIMTVKITHDVIRVGDPILLKIDFNNTGTTSVCLIRIFPEQDNELSVVDKLGHAVPLTAYGKQIASEPRRSPRVFLFLKPGEKYSEEVKLLEVVDIKEPGKYAVRVKRSYYPGERGYEGVSAATRKETTSDVIYVNVIERKGP